MATNPIEGGDAVVTIPGTMPPMPAVARVLSRFDRAQLGSAIEVMIALLDVQDSSEDPDAPDFSLRGDGRPGDPADEEEAGDHRDMSWPEWHTRGRHKLARGRFEARDGMAHEDDELAGDEQDIAWVEPTSRYSNAMQLYPGANPQNEDDEEETDFCLAGDDRVCSGAVISIGLLHEDMGPGEADDGEREQMMDDVPMLQVVSAEHNIFTDARVVLGISNLQTSFRTNGGDVRSADSGSLHRSPAGDDRKPGSPV